MADQTEQTPATTPAAPQSTFDAMNVAFAEALKAEGLVKGSEETPAAQLQSVGTSSNSAGDPPPVQQATKPADEVPVAPEKSWEKLMQEKAELRRQQEALKASPQLAIPNAQALAKAVQSGDALGAISALGFTYADVTKQLLATPEAPPAAVTPAAEATPAALNLPPELQQRLQRLDQLEAWAMQQQRQSILNNVKEVLPADKFKLITGRGEYETVLGYLERFHAETGTLPGATFNESVQIAAEALEARLAQEAEKWKKVLTPAQPPANVQGEAQRSPPQSGQVTSPVNTTKTLTNTTTAPAAVKPELTTRAEIFADLLKDPEFNR